MNIKTAAVLCSVWACASAHAQTGAVIYAQNFEAPNPGTSCIKFGNVAAGLTGTPATDAGSFARDYSGTGQVGSASFQQVGTADRLCWDMATAPLATRITDPSGIGGRFSGGFGRNASGNIEAWGAAFDPQGQAFVNGRLDLSVITPGNVNPALGQATPEAMQLDFYKIPSGTFTLTSGVPAGVGPAPVTRLGAPLPLAVGKAGLPVTQFTTQWQAQNFSIDTSTVSGGERVLIVATAVDVNSYFAFDNIVITAAPTAVPEVTLSCTPSVLTDSPSQQAICTITANQPVLSDLVVGLTAAPASSPRYTSNCGPTVTILASTTTASCTITAVDNTVPGDGNVTASLALLPDTAASARYTVGAPSTASVQVQDDDPPLPVVSLGCTPTTLTDSANQQASCTVTASHAAAADLDVLITPPVTHARYASPLKILAGQTTASCTFTASDNVVVGDGDVSATLSLLADASATPRYVLGTPDRVNLLVQDDDQAAPAAVVQDVPSLSPWALAGLMGLTAAAAAWGRRRSR